MELHGARLRLPEAEKHPPVSGRNVKHLMPDTLDTSSFAKAFGICPRGPKERLSHAERGVPGGRLGSEKKKDDVDPQTSNWK